MVEISAFFFRDEVEIVLVLDIVVNAHFLHVFAVLLKVNCVILKSVNQLSF
jgi:hypothetical protein